jgi:hypothetical protein
MSDVEPLGSSDRGPFEEKRRAGLLGAAVARKVTGSEVPNSVWERDPTGLLALGRAQSSRILTMQKRLLDAYEQIQLVWLARVRSEADLWSELVARLQEARPGPEAFQAYQQTLVQRMELAVQDGRRLIDETEKTLAILTQLIGEDRTDSSQSKTTIEKKPSNPQT